MPPRFAYWTIILNGKASSFRAREPEELLPTFNRLKKQDPTAVMKWFSGGTLWDSPEQAAEKRRLDRERLRPQARPDDGRSWGGRTSRPQAGGGRSSGWRPVRERPRHDEPVQPEKAVAKAVPRPAKVLPRLPAVKPKA